MDAVAKVGQAAPSFQLRDLAGAVYSLQSARNKIVVLNFWSAECPWSRAGDEFIRAASLEGDWGESVVHWRVASNANESSDELAQAAAERQVKPVLLDSQHEVADLYGAMTTPHLFVIDADGLLRYAGALNDATWREPEPSRNYLAEAVAAAKQGRSPDPAETPGRGCTIVRYKID
jgi:peroxiredoxin